MADRIHLLVETADGIALQKDVSYVSLPLNEGSLGILPNHGNMLCALGSGELKYRTEAGESEKLRIDKGAAHVEHNTVTVLTNKCE